MNKKGLLRNFWYGLSSRQRFIIRRFYFMPIDLYDKLTGKTHKYVPPRGQIYTGYPANANVFINQGVEQLKLLNNTINIKPNDSVLDIGSGIGRTAIALTNHLDKNGSYDGFDVVKLGVDWCNTKINKDFKNFNFKYVPLFNDLYNNATLKAEEFVFPYKNASFDKIFTFSVFTHMQISEIQRYFKEANRVLKQDGLAFSTFFLYDSENENYISNRDDFSFPVKKEGYRLMSDKVKSGNIAIHKDNLRNMLANENLEIVEIIDGFWKDEIPEKTKVEYQDMVVFKKKSD